MTRAEASRVVLDTHVLVWLMVGDARLTAPIRQAVENASYADGVYVSAISLWEVAMLVEKDRMRLRRDVGEWIDMVVAHPAITVAPLVPEIAVASTRLPGELNRDPADRIIVATARTLDAVLVTADSDLLAYGAAGYVTTVSAVEDVRF